SWYRGCRNTAFTLQPTLYRHPDKKNILDIADLESSITTRFVQRSLPFLSRPLTDDWDKLFLMQHYGVPTRLLDWSENPFVSIYFSLVSSSLDAVDACLWMCNPAAWNHAALNHIGYKGGVLDPGNSAIRGYAPGSAFSEMPKVPIMIYGSYNSPRIVAQRGGFALFGQGTEPMETVFIDQQFPAGALTKIQIPHSNVDEIRQSLFRKGFTESVVFPDLEGLAKELRRVFEF
ncbi:MAG: FRG domain-containing protein, partial [Proteobacteria bacterium]